MTSGNILRTLILFSVLTTSPVLAAQGKFDGAKHHIHEVLRMDPDNAAARQILERIEYLDRSQ